MTLSGEMKMKPKSPKIGAFGADKQAHTAGLELQTSKNAVKKAGFSAPC
jgi:hypothetical protein